MLEVKLDEKLKKYIVATLSSDSRYIIVCENEYDAKSLCTQIMMGMIPSPVDNPLKYRSNGVCSDGKTEIFVMK